jgi:UTP--glucose-1-phosphate uridylyltransferase
MHAPVRKAVFPVGGLGTRFLPATKSVPKEMLTVVDRPLIHYAFEEARKAGIEEFIFVTARGKTAIADYFDRDEDLERALETKQKHDLLAAVRVHALSRSGVRVPPWRQCLQPARRGWHDGRKLRAEHKVPPCMGAS